jgi:hypothetical protein
VHLCLRLSSNCLSEHHSETNNCQQACSYTGFWRVEVNSCSVVFWNNFCLEPCTVLNEENASVSTARFRTELSGFSPRANYTDRAIAVCRRSLCQLLRTERCCVGRAVYPYGHKLDFLDPRSRLLYLNTFAIIFGFSQFKHKFRIYFSLVPYSYLRTRCWLIWNEVKRNCKKLEKITHCGAP